MNNFDKLSNWKQQYFYQKKLEVYCELIPYLIKLKSKYYPLQKGYLSEVDVVDILNDIQIHIQPLREKFVVYYGEEYREPIDDLIRLFFNVYEDNNKMFPNEIRDYVEVRFNIIYLTEKETLNPTNWFSSIPKLD